MEKCVISTIIIITVPTKPPGSGGRSAEQEDTTIKIKLEGEGSVADLLREAADVIDGNGE